MIDRSTVIQFVRSGDMANIFTAQKDKRAMVKWKLYPGQKQLHYTAKRKLTLASVCTDCFLNFSLCRRLCVHI